MTDSIYDFLVTPGESLTMGSTDAEQQHKQPSHVAVGPRTNQRSTGRVRTLQLRFIRCFGSVITAVLIAWRIAAAPTAASLPTPYSSILDQSGGLVYRTGVIQSKEEWITIVTEATALSKSSSLREESVSSIAHHRLGIALSPTSSPTVQILNDPQSAISQLVQKVAGAVTHPHRPSSTTKTIVQPPITTTQYVLAPHIPVELRSYERMGAGMAWHVDDVLYHPVPQIEMVFTIINTSNCRTLWKMHHHDAEDDSNSFHEQETDPNSILLLRAGVVPHCVTALQYGKRIILKCAYIPDHDATTYVGGCGGGDGTSKRSSSSTTSTPQFPSAAGRRSLRKQSR
jgi:hypothetical protein